MPYTAPKKSVKEVRYLNKDFTSFKDNLIEFAKVYFPNTYNDFNEASPGMMFIEMASYVGDVLSYYIDNQFKESLLAFAQEKRTVYNMAQTFGYKPKLASPSLGRVDVFQIVPAIAVGTGADYTVKPDLEYGLKINQGMKLSSTNGTQFRTTEDVNFRYSSSIDPMKVSVYESTGNVPVTYLLKKSAKIESGETKTEFFTFSNAEKYSRISLAEQNVTEVISCTDDDGNNWYEVGYLAQDSVFADMENDGLNDPDLATFSDSAPYLLRLIKTSRRFTTFIRTDGRTELRFGAGISDSPDEEIVPNPENVGSSLPGSPSKLGEALDPSNFLKTRSYGQAPSNTTLAITYRYGGGVDHNSKANSIREIISMNQSVQNPTTLNSGLLSTTRASVKVTNPSPTTGGSGAESIFDVKQNTLAYFQAQSRAVTREDYITRVYSMPPRFGNIAKAHIVQDSQIDPAATVDEVQSGNRIFNPMAMNFYVLGYNANKSVINVNQAVKENIQTYLTQFRMITDAINIKDAFIINIGVRFNILTRVGYNKEEVLLKAIEKVKEFFNIDKWQIAQPIVLADLAYQISLVDGVSAIVPPEDNDVDSSVQDKPVIQIVNKFSSTGGYSGNLYDIKTATKNGIVYPSADPSIFELKYPGSDIEGRCVGNSTGTSETGQGGSY
jgi:hypothetical protein|tara:strand:- start:1149 stop:3149 length:2001 start_codon:yes stop_codon:yes gene_type:complete